MDKAVNIEKEIKQDTHTQTPSTPGAAQRARDKIGFSEKRLLFPPPSLEKYWLRL